MSKPKVPQGPTDYLGQPIQMGDLVTFTTSVRSSNLNQGVIGGYNDEKGSLSIHVPGYKQGTTSKTTIQSVYDTGKFSRVCVITPLYLSLPDQNDELVALHKLYQGQPWPVKKVVISTQSPITKWVRGFTNNCGDFKKSTSARYGQKLTNDGYVIDYGKKYIDGDFTTQHNGEKIFTSVKIKDGKVAIYIRPRKGGYGGDFIAAYGNDVSRYNQATDKLVFGIDWFNDQDVLHAVEKAIKIVEKQ